MLRCGHCSEICESYEDWLAHLVTEAHQAKLGMSEVFNSHKNEDRNERSLLMFHMNPKTDPYQVVSHFAVAEPLGFVTDAFVHIFPNVNEKFYLIVYDQRKFVERICTTQERCGDQKVLSSVVHCRSKASLTEKEWEAKIESSFFYRRHEHLRRSLTEMPWEEQLSMFLDIVSLGESGYQDREKVMDELETLIREVYSNATVNPFGSCTTWLADTQADLDVYVDAIGSGGKSDIDQDTRDEIMRKITTLLRDKYNRMNVVSIKSARIPIIKLDHPSGLKIDFSFENCLSVQNSKMIRLMTKLDYRVRPFLVFLRYWTRFHNLIGPQSIKSYALILMALVYLKKKKILPTVHDIQTIEGTRPCMVSGWNATFCNNREIVQNTIRGLKCVKEPPSTDRIAQEIMQFVYGFFAEYATFDFENQVICPLVGEYLPKVSFDSLNGVDLPQEMGLLKANLVTGQCTSFQTQRPLCIQDPFILNVNVTSSCRTSEIIYKFKAVCAMAAEALKPFATVYDSADKENILDLCCQQLTTEKLQEVMKMSKPEEDHDNMAYVKTEATTTTNEYEDHNMDEIERPHPSSVRDANNPSGDALQSIKDFYKDEYNYQAFSKSEEKDRRDRPSSSRDSWSSNDNSRYRDRERDNPTRVQRISMFDNADKPSTVTQPESIESYQFYPGYTVPTSPILSPEATQKDEENPLKKALRSIIVVANKGVKIESESGTGTSSARTPSTATPSSPSKKNKKDSGESIASPTKKAKEKSVKCVPMVVDNKEKRNSKDAQSKVNAEPVVKFIPSSVTHLDNFQSFLTTQASSSRLSTSGERQTSTRESNRSRNQSSESLLIEEQVVQFVGDVEMEAPIQQIPPPEISVRFDDNYGYAIKSKAVSQVEVQKSKPKSIDHYVTPKRGIDNQGGGSGGSSPLPASPDRGIPCEAAMPPSPKGSELYFPAFAVYLSEEFYNSFCNTLGSLPMYENVLLMKTKVFWVNCAVELFSNTQFWEKIHSILEEDSFTDVKLEQDKALLIFEEVDRHREELLSEDATAYIPNRKRPHASKSSSSEALSPTEQGPSAKLRKPSSTNSPTHPPPVTQKSDSAPSYQFMSTLVQKLSQLPSPFNIRKKYAQAFFFRCHPSILTLLKDQWMRISSRLESEYPGTSPIDMLGEICEQIRVTLPCVPPTEEWVNIKMLVAFDTSGQPPGLYFGFEYEHRADDPTYDKQAGIHVTLETIFKDIIPAHIMHMMVKYFNDIP